MRRLPPPPSYKVPIRIALYILFIFYLLADLHFGGPLKTSADKKLEEAGLTASSKRKKDAVARIYGEFITRDELETRFREELFLGGKKEDDFTPENLKTWKLFTLNKMVDEALVRLKTKVNEMRRPFRAELVEKEWAAFVSRFPSEGELDCALAAQKLSRNSLKLLLEARIQEEVHLDANIAPPAEPGEEELKIAYDELKEAYTPTLYREVSHIFLATLHKNPDEVRVSAEQLLGEIKQGASFEQLATQYSEDERSAPKGGKLGKISDSRTLPGNLEKNIFALPDNEAVLVESPLGFHIMIASPVEKQALPPYDELLPELKTALRTLRRQTALDIYLRQIKKEGLVKKWVELYPDRI